MHIGVSYKKLSNNKEVRSFKHVRASKKRKINQITQIYLKFNYPKIIFYTKVSMIWITDKMYVSKHLKDCIKKHLGSKI